MTDLEVEATAREIAGKWFIEQACNEHLFSQPMLIAYITHALAAEREGCARVIPTSWIDPLMGKLGDPPYWGTDIEALLSAIADAIRARNEEGGR